jgi:2-dehydro-3-deoxy-D-gluconate 5-dehydrogenase
MMEPNTRFRLHGRTALVTGASRGIGQAIAVGLARAGANVVCASSAAGGTEETRALVEQAGRHGWSVAADLTNRAAVRALGETATGLAGPIDILVNNAGTIRRHPATEFPQSSWDEVMRTNLDAAWLLSQQLGAQMVSRGNGVIINIASLLSFSGGITVPAYTASKHAIAGLTKALANEWAGSGVRVNAIAPGYIETDNTEQLRNDPTRLAQISARIPAGRWGHPDDLAGPVVFLASDAASYIHGHVLVVDGGWMAR